ncbi:MAG: FAD-dependent oxidoreductase [Gemmataceae bacterium]|nr:FAD-dependent oxidoreductase [Gemmataceae bacterium]MDW8263893.1 FAD-dependent oxidoreductase [Gemmataceae bacterium]
MSASNRQVVVIGGGAIGAACAYYLCRAGCTVTLLERDRFGKGCSHGNCGFISPSHVLPLAEPGLVGKVLKSLFHRKSPFRVQPRFDLNLWAWLLQFARRCNRTHLLAGGRAIQPLLASSRRLYDELMAAELTDCEWHTQGVLFVFRSVVEMEAYAESDRLLRDEFGVASYRLSSAEVEAREPALKPGMVGAFHYPGDAHLRPDKLMAAWRRALEARGVTIREHCPLTGFVGPGDTARAAATPAGEFPGDAFVLATGAWTPLLREAIGRSVPIQPGKGYSITMPRPRLCPSLPLIFPEHKVAITPMDSGYRIGSTMEFAGYDATLNSQRLAFLRESAALYLREPLAEPVLEEWFGWRPMTYDSLPIIDRSPRWANVWITAGHNMLGISMSPATGKLVSELITGQPPHLDPRPYALSRF